MKKLAFFLALLGMVAGAYWLWHASFPKRPLRESSPRETPAPSFAPALPPSSNTPPGIPAATGALLDAHSQAAVAQCLGMPARTWQDLDAALDTLGIAPARFLWKVASVQEDGSEIRLRLEAKGPLDKPGNYDLRLFSVDEEGLPDPLPPRPGQQENPEAWFETFLRGKPLLHQASRELLSLPGGRKAEREKAEGVLEEVQVTGNRQELDCALRTEEPGCTCHRATD